MIVYFTLIVIFIIIILTLKTISIRLYGFYILINFFYEYRLSYYIARYPSNRYSDVCEEGFSGRTRTPRISRSVY